MTKAKNAVAQLWQGVTAFLLSFRLYVSITLFKTWQTVLTVEVKKIMAYNKNIKALKGSKSSNKCLYTAMLLLLHYFC